MRFVKHEMVWLLRHFARYCKRERNGSKPVNQYFTQSRGDMQQKHPRGSGRQAYFVEADILQPSKDDSFAFTIEEHTCALSASGPVIAVKIDGISKETLIDSCSECILMSQESFQEFQRQGLKAEL